MPHKPADGVTPLLRMTHDMRFAEGDHVTRDGTDVQLVAQINEAGDGAVFRCIKAPADGWCQVGEEEFNITSRYERIRK